ncbi:MAG: uracil-DNA glycosylase family protein [Flavobacteriales bacterium]
MLADRLLPHVLQFSLKDTKLPKGIGVLDPFNGPNAEEVRRIVTLFHHKYYSDNKPRTLMLGINPGRLGAGSTGLSFTDTKRCESDLGIAVNGLRTHEPSSDFFYRMISAAGGAEDFYSKVYVHAVCPLGFVKEQANGTAINLNYYDDKALEKAVTPFVENWLRTLAKCGLRTDTVLCIGTGKNAAYFSKLNERLGLFERIIALEHPRYVMQYKARSMELYIDKYLAALVDIR